MKKNLVLTICFCLLLGTAGMAASFDTILAFGTGKAIQGNNGDLKNSSIEYIFQTYVNSAWNWEGHEQLNGNPHSVIPDTGGVYGILIQDFGWTYAILASNASNEWYLFRNDHVMDGEEGFLAGYIGSDPFYGDNYLVIPERYALFDAFNDVTGLWETDVKFDTAGNMSKLNQLDITTFFNDCTGNDCGDGGFDDFAAPEPGTILLLGTGVIGLGIVARRKLIKK